MTLKYKKGTSGQLFFQIKVLITFSISNTLLQMVCLYAELG